MGKKLGDLIKKYPENIGTGPLRCVPIGASIEIHKKLVRLLKSAKLEELSSLIKYDSIKRDSDR